MPDEKKVDEEWKKKIEQEKTPAQEDSEGADESAEAAGRAEDEAAGEKPQQPQPDFLFLVRNLATQALISLGEFPHPVSKTKDTDLESARFSIDLLAMLEQKTKGNLEDLEHRYLDAILHDLRMKFLEASK